MPQRAHVTAYEYALLATEDFLRRVGEQHWADWLHEDVIAWRATRSVSHHRLAYGGMGSFNDVFISRTNRHLVSAEQEPWANTLLEWLQAILFHLSKHPGRAPTADELRRAVHPNASVLSVFVGALLAFVRGNRAHDSTRGGSGTGVRIVGWRCLVCGYAELTPRDLDLTLAEEIVPELVFRGCAEGTLAQTVDDVLSLTIPDLARRRKQLRVAAEASGIRVIDRPDWMRPCPRCGADDTAVYRWKYSVSNSPEFEPMPDNLQLRRSKMPNRLRHNEEL